MKPILCPILSLSLFSAIALAKEPVDYIDPFIGTGHFGKTYPGAATPGGMVQLSPDTITGGDNGSGYRHYHKTLQGFSLTHMSGVGWFGDLGNFLVMPTTGPLKTYYGTTDKPGTGYLSRFSNATETAQAGYYAVTLEDYQIRAELTAAPHSGILRFTFPEHAQSRIQVDLARRVGGTSLHQSVRATDDHSIEGFIECTPDGGGWGHGDGRGNYTFYYHAEFSRPWQKMGVWSSALPPGPYRNDVMNKPEFVAAGQNAEILPDCREKEGQHLGFYSEFPTQAGEVVQVKVGISFVSIEGARANLQAEIPDWSFDNVRSQARGRWSAALRRMSVEGGSEDQKTAFYTALYHSRLDPRIFADINGDYPGGDGKPHSTREFTKRTIFSGWDVYRSEMPLLTIIAPEIVNDLINSMVELAGQNRKGNFDRWEFLNAYSGCMNGNPMVTVLNDAYRKGIRGYNVEQAYACAVKTCGNSGKKASHLAGTLEDGMANWNLAQLATQLGKTNAARMFGERSLIYRTLFDSQQAWTYDATGLDGHPGWQGCLRPKDEKGDWLPWAGLTSGKGCVEGTIVQYNWMVPYDITGLMELHHGAGPFVAKLTEFFERTPPLDTWSGPGRKGGNEVSTVYYNHPNEPVHLVPFLFNRAGAPWLTQKWVRWIDSAYTPGSEGLCGDEDVGQMSAWFILASIGLQQACPGDTRYEIFTPLFDRTVINLDSKYAHGGKFTVAARNNSPENVYIQSASLNGKSLNRCWLDYQEILAGGTLDLVLGPQPNRQWGVSE